MTKDWKLTTGYDGLDMPCQGCYENDYYTFNHQQTIHLIVSEKDKEGVYNTFFYCGACAGFVVEEIRIAISNVGLPRGKNRKIYKLTSEELERYRTWMIIRGKERISKDWKKSGH